MKTRHEVFWQSNTDNICQLDGNGTVSESDDEHSSMDILSDSDNSSDETVVQPNEAFDSLPRILATNARSVFPKFKDLTEHLENHRIDIGHISESWEDINSKDHKEKKDVLENRSGFYWFSYARPKYKEDKTKGGGGGSAVLVNKRHYNACIIEEITVPKNVELVWVKIIPKYKCDFKIFIVCGLYSKPNSKTKTITNDHIAENYHYLKAKYSSIKFYFLGDYNDLRPDAILQQSPQLRQLVHYPTCGRSSIDFIITDAHNRYHPPFPLPPLQPSNPL